MATCQEATLPQGKVTWTCLHGLVWCAGVPFGMVQVMATQVCPMGHAVQLGKPGEALLGCYRHSPMPKFANEQTEDQATSLQTERQLALQAENPITAAHICPEAHPAHTVFPAWSPVVTAQRGTCGAPRSHVEVICTPRWLLRRPIHRHK